jgi:hypothetical protein
MISQQPVKVLPRLTKLLFDHSTSRFFEDIGEIRSYMVMCSDTTCHDDVLLIARRVGAPLLTLDNGFMNASKEDNDFGILILTDEFRDINGVGLLKQLLLDYSDEVDKIGYRPPGIYITKKAGVGWTVEQVLDN